jgi:hypothetical protein
VTAALTVGPLQAFRYWYVRWEEGQAVLQSLYYPTRWPPDAPLRASCEKKPGYLVAWTRKLFAVQTTAHPSPASECWCGIYALKQLEGIEHRELLPQLYQPGPDRGVHVIGVVLLWGRVIQHEHGYRAEYARPLRLLTGPPDGRCGDIDRLLAAASRRYAIPLVSRVEELLYPERAA